MSQRRAPRIMGYTLGAKDLYRRWVWNAFIQELPCPPASAIVGLMPSVEGIEVATAIRKGIAERNIHAIDDNPAIIATVKRAHPGITSYGVSVMQAFERMAKTGVRLDACNLDLTACLSESFSDTMEAVARSLVLNPQQIACLAITMQRGRESVGTFSGELYENATDDLASWNRLRPGGTDPITMRDMARASAALGSFRATDYLILPRRVGVYQSAHVTMLFVVALLINPSRTRLGPPRDISEWVWWTRAVMRARIMLTGGKQYRRVMRDLRVGDPELIDKLRRIDHERRTLERKIVRTGAERVQLEAVVAQLTAEIAQLEAQGPNDHPR